MNISKLAPWNWFRDEEKTEVHSLPVETRSGGPHLDPLSRLHDEVNRLFETTMSSFGLSPPALPDNLSGFARNLWLKPSLDVAASDTEYSINIEIPGVDEKDIKLELVDDKLIVTGEKTRETREKDKDFYRVERSYGSFRRVLTLPEDADQNGIQATHRNGVLAITMPRRKLASKTGRRIEITNGG